MDVNRYMKKLFLIAMLFSSVAFAESKIMSIDLNKSLILSNYAQQQLQALKNNEQYKKLTAQAKTLEAEIVELQKKGKANSLTWSEKQKQDHIKTGKGKVEQLRKIAQQQASMQQQLEAQVEQQLAPKVEAIVNDIIKEKNIGLLIDSKAVYYRTAEFDITKEVVERLNKAQ